MLSKPTFQSLDTLRAQLEHIPLYRLQSSFTNFSMSSFIPFRLSLAVARRDEKSFLVVSRRLSLFRSEERRVGKECPV